MSFPPPMGPPPGMMGPPPMPPMMPPPMPGPPPGPPPEEPEPPTMLETFLIEIAKLLNDGKKKEAKELIAELPDEAIDLLRAMAKDNEVIDTLLSPLLPKEDTKPIYPVWYRKEDYPKPDHAAVTETVEQDAQWWETARTRDADTLKYYVIESGYGFPNRDTANDLPFISTALRDETDAIVSKVSAATYTYELPFTSMSLVDSTQQVEDFLSYCDTEANATHEDATGQDLTWATAWFGVVFGRMMTLVVFDPENIQHPLCEKLCDPSTTYPVWEGNRGLERVSRRYQDTALNVIGDFDYDGEIETAIKKAINKQTGNPYQMTDTGIVTQYWDRRWYVCYFNDIELISTAHDYGFPPFAVTLSAIGMPMGMSDPAQSSVPVMAQSPDPWLKYMATGHMEPQKKAHDQREAVGSVLYTIMSKADRPAWLVYQDDFARALGAPQMPNTAGDRALLMKERELAEPMYLSAPPTAFAPLMTMMGSDRQTNLSPPESLGISQGANQSGNAMAQANELGMNKLAPHLAMMERHKRAIAAIRLAIWRDWGHMWQNADGEYGQITVPYQSRQRRMKPGLPPAFTLEPKTLRKVGNRVRVHSSSIPLQALGPLGNAVTIWHDQQMMSRRTAMEIRGETDPDAEFEELLYEDTILDPEIAKVKKLQILQKRDPETAALYKELIKSGGGGPPQPPGSLVPNTSAMNLPGLGLGPTGPTGRPPGMMPPPPPQGMGMPPPPGPPLLYGPNGSPLPGLGG